MSPVSPPDGAVASTVVLLLVLLAEREVLRAFTDRPRGGAILGAALVPLLVVFVAVVTARTAALLP